HQNTQQFGAMLPIELTNADIRNSNAYKEYYVVATGATPPKTKDSVQKTESSFDTIVAMTEVQQLKLATKRSMQQTHISHASGSGTYKGTGNDDDDDAQDDDEQEDEGDDDEDYQEEGSDDEQASDKK
nr:hypothetical protein [Tanacetum cinerariifolium]